MTGPYINIQTSLLTYCNNFLSRNNVDDFEVFDFENHAVTNELPDSNLIGLFEYAIENQTDLYEITCVIAVCTLADDSALEILRSVIDKLFKELKPGSQLPIVNIDSSPAGQEIGKMVVMDNVKVFPVSKTKVRPIQGIGIRLGASYFAPLT